MKEIKKNPKVFEGKKYIKQKEAEVIKSRTELPSHRKSFFFFLFHIRGLKQ